MFRTRFSPILGFLGGAVLNERIPWGSCASCAGAAPPFPRYRHRHCFFFSAVRRLLASPLRTPLPSGLGVHQVGLVAGDVRAGLARQEQVGGPHVDRMKNMRAEHGSAEPAHAASVAAGRSGPPHPRLALSPARARGGWVGLGWQGQRRVGVAAAAAACQDGDSGRFSVLVAPGLCLWWV